MFSYHDTVDERGKTLDQYEEKAKRQEDVILGIFRNNPGVHFTPFEIRELYLNPKPPITSVRRAITNIEKSFAGKNYGIRKTATKKKGEFGRDNYTWVYVPALIQKDLFQ